MCVMCKGRKQRKTNTYTKYKRLVPALWGRSGRLSGACAFVGSTNSHVSSEVLTEHLSDWFAGELWRQSSGEAAGGGGL